MLTQNYIAAISSYGTISKRENPYLTAIMFSDKEKFLAALTDFLRMQIMIASMVPEYKKELEEVNSSSAFCQIKEGIEELSKDFESIMPLDSQLDNRLLISIPAILTDFHIEILQPTENDLVWLERSNKIGILTMTREEGCILDDGEFLLVNQICDPAEKTHPQTEENPDCIGMTLLEKYNHLLGGAFSLQLIKP